MSKRRSLGGFKLNAIHNVDCAAGLRALPPDCIDVAITSPPYWGQRGSAGIGSEEDPRAYLQHLVTILAEVMRCLKPTGTLWVNVGDAYNTPINWRGGDHAYSSLGKDGLGLAPTNSAYTKERGKRRAFIRNEVPWLQYGNLLAIPERIIIGLCDLGFLFRGEVIWQKSRPLPEGICRRPHRKHEGIYLFAKSERHSFRVRPPVPSIWTLTQTPNLTAHSSTFPPDLPRQCIDASAIVGRGLVLDPFMGSGTTARAAIDAGHDYLGFELDPAMCEIAARAG